MIEIDRMFERYMVILAHQRHQPNPTSGPLSKATGLETLLLHAYHKRQKGAAGGV
jgi:hypothetical protein